MQVVLRLDIAFRHKVLFGLRESGGWGENARGGEGERELRANGGGGGMNARGVRASGGGGHK